MKPDAPDQVRGTFRPIVTCVPGTQICEHLPRLARHADKYALIRSMSHHFSTHNPAGYYTLSGTPPDRDQFDIRRSPDDHPNPGALTAKDRSGRVEVPPFVQISGPLVGDIGFPKPGQTGGFLGASYDPFCVTLDPNQCLSALLEDLEQRGLLESTLVASLGEFGRTPRMGQTTGENGTDQTGRDHWPHCYSVLLAGGGVTGGAVIGKSDRYAARPTERPTAPEDLVATIYDALGLAWGSEINDRLGRPLPITRGRPVAELFNT